MQFSKTKLSVLNPMNSLQNNHGYTIRYDSVYLTCSKKLTGSRGHFFINGIQNVHLQRSHTLAVEYATDDHAVLIE